MTTTQPPSIISNRITANGPTDPSFIGRHKEIAELERLLAEPACRLVTLVGPGGIGKTTLAHQIANQINLNQDCPKPSFRQFRDGAIIAPLQPIQSPTLIAATVAEKLGLSLSGTNEPLPQVCHYLSNKAMLLILDNFEHLLDGIDTLLSLLHETINMKVVVTSREALNLQEEWLYPIAGLTYPQDSRQQNEFAPSMLEQSQAAQLFGERARRVRPDFSLRAQATDVLRICQLVEGTPLALELAATWVKSLTCADIAQEIEQNLDFLTSRLRNVPHRHQSMQAVFSHSWSLLPEIEQSIFMRLSTFRGGFTADAANQVSGASSSALTGLVDKSLIRWEGDGRYRLHELLRQYAQEKLTLHPPTLNQVRTAHCTYFTDFLYARRDAVTGDEQQTVVAAVEEEIDNIRAAWEWAVEQTHVDSLDKMVRVLPYYYQIRSRYREGATTYSYALEALEQEQSTTDGDNLSKIERTQIVLLVYLGWLSIRLG